MGNFRSDNGSRRFSRDRTGFRDREVSGRREGGFRGRSEGGFGRDRDRRPLEMHKAICDKCKKQCEVPFKPTGDKPVFCSDCFRKEGDFGSNSRNRNTSTQSGISSEQFKQINVKLDKIIEFLDKFCANLKKA